MPEFMFATGIECSYPTIEHGRWRMDLLDATGHYRSWKTDLELVTALGLKYLRYGPPLHRIHLGPDRYDWSFTEDVLARMKSLGIVPIIDLCHFGVPDWLENFQNPDFPKYFAEYAAAFARRFPWVKIYTPVNEIYVCARMSALLGLWNEQLKSERGFVTAVLHLAKGCVLAMEAILRERPDAIFVTSESSEFYQACCPDSKIRGRADFENQRRFIALDLVYAHPIREDMLEFLFAHGFTKTDYEWFMNRRAWKRAIMGLDYYTWNEKLVDSNGHVQNLGELFGWYVITMQYWERYKRPVMHTETNTMEADLAPGWLWRQWHNVELIRENGVPVLGFTWYSLLDQVDWDVGLSHSCGNVNPVGLFDLNRDPRPVAQAYKHLLELYSPGFRDKALPHLDEVLRAEVAPA
jgi:beta-glucosidase/6-phospho-beta-glucosidase/beta-galactosidase